MKKERFQRCIEKEFFEKTQQKIWKEYGQW